jgi:RimK-like ATP-grasp domain
MISRAVLIGWNADPTLAYLRAKLDDASTKYDFVSFDRICDPDTIDIHIPTIEHNSRIFTRWMLADSHYRIPLVSELLERIVLHEPTAICGNPLANRSNASKAVHLRKFAPLCREYGILLPPTLVFCDKKMLPPVPLEGTAMIIKGASARKSICRNFVTKDDDRGQRHFALLQERIDGPDVRVHLVGSQTFAELIVSNEVDYRFASKKSFAAVSLPESVQRFCLECCAMLRVPFAGIDFKVSQDGDWYFLETNTSPAFQGYDRRAKGAISRALGDWLS